MDYIKTIVITATCVNENIGTIKCTDAYVASLIEEYVKIFPQAVLCDRLDSGTVSFLTEKNTPAKRIHNIVMRVFPAFVKMRSALPPKFICCFWYIWGGWLGFCGLFSAICQGIDGNIKRAAILWLVGFAAVVIAFLHSKSLHHIIIETECIVLKEYIESLSEKETKNV